MSLVSAFFSFLPSSSPLPPLTRLFTYSLILLEPIIQRLRTYTPSNLQRLSHLLTRSLTHLLTYCTLTLPAVFRDLIIHSLSHSLADAHSQSQSLTYSVTHSLTHTPRACHPETAEGAAARVVAAGPPFLSAVAGAVPRACRRGCGARCRRWAPLALCSGRRSTQSLQKGLRRALSPLGPLRFCALLPL